MMTSYKIFHFNQLQAACTVLWGADGRCAVADPGCYGEEERAALEAFLAREHLTPEALLLTHGHPDHISSAAWFHRRFGVTVWMNPAERQYLPVFRRFGAAVAMDVDIDFPTADAVDGVIIPVGSLSLQVIETPGHSRGGVCYYDAAGQILLSGDTLFAGCIGRTDFTGGDYDMLIRSILDRLMPLPSDTLVIPGHGPVTSIGAEAGSNPFLEPFNEPED